MKTATIQVRKDARQALDEMGRRFVKSWRTDKSTDALIVFESPQALFSVLTPKRWELIECLQTLGPSSLRGLARELERDVKRAHEDVRILEDWDLVARTEEGKIHVPYDLIHADFDLHAEAV